MSSANPRLLLPILVVGAWLAMGCSRDPGAVTATAVALERAGRWGEAAALLRAEAMRLGPAAWDGPLKRAIVDYLMANDLAAAESFVAECLARNPLGHEVLYYLGDSQRVLMDYEGAQKTLDRLLSLRPDHATGALALGHVKARLGHPTEAVALFERYLAHDGGPPQLRSLARVEWARALKRLGRKQEAADRLSSLLESEPYHTVALSEAAQLFAQLGRAELARGLRSAHAWLFERGHQLSVEDESKVYSTGPNSEADVARLALQAADRREFLVALRQLEDLVARQPSDAITAAALARLWLRLFRCHEASRVAATARSLGARSADLCRLEGEARMALGNEDAARSLLAEASRMVAEPGALRGEDKAFVLDTHWQAVVSALASKLDEAAAQQALARLEAVASGDWRVGVGKARLELEAGRVAPALALMESEMARPGGRPAAEVRRWFGLLRGLSGDLKTAARELMALVKEDPGEVENFRAFERAFFAERQDPQVLQVLELKRQLEGRHAARREAARTAAELPLGASAAAYLSLGKLLAEEAGEREAALDVFFLAAGLDPGASEPLGRAVPLLARPQDTFVRLWALRGVLVRSPDDPPALQALARAYLELGARLDEAEALALALKQARPGSASDELLGAIREERQRRR